MKLEVAVACYHDWEVRHESEVGPEDVAVPSHLSPSLRNVQVTRQEPNTVEVVVPDSQLDRMEADHRAGVEAARTGYTATHEGGSQHGETVVVAPRNLPLRSRRALLADHLATAVLPLHAPAEHVRAVRITESNLEPGEQAALERYLNRRLVEDEGEAAE